jgi:integrase/recombinase XerD
MDTALKDFLIYISSEKGLAANTREAYRRDIESFFVSLREQGLTDLLQLTQQHIVRFLAARKDAEYATASISRSCIAVKVFCRFLKREGVTPTNVAAQLDTPKIWQLIPDVLSEKEVERLLQQPDATTALGARDQAILEVLYA